MRGRRLTTLTSRSRSCATRGVGSRRAASRGDRRPRVSRSLRPTRMPRKPSCRRCASSRAPRRAFRSSCRPSASRLLTFTCLKSVNATAPPGLYEVLVVDDGRRRRSSRNFRWCAGCASSAIPVNLDSSGAATRRWRTRGDIVVFLNNDTIATAGWLEALLAVDRHPEAGLVGEAELSRWQVAGAGGIVWRDGSAWNDGRDGDPTGPSSITCERRTTARARASPWRGRCSRSSAASTALRAGVLRGCRPRLRRARGRAQGLLPAAGDDRPLRGRTSGTDAARRQAPSGRQPARLRRQVGARARITAPTACRRTSSAIAGPADAYSSSTRAC